MGEAHVGEVYRALAVFVEPPSPEHEVVASVLELGELPTAAEHTDLFDFQLFPHASVYLSDSGFKGGEARDRIAGFWRVLELEPPRDPDHLTVLLAAYGALLDREAVAASGDHANWRHVRQVFLHEHLLSWLPLYLQAVREHAGTFHCRWVDRLEEVLASESLDEAVASELPAALRELAPVPDPRVEGGGPWLAALLAPARAGFILTRDALAGLARETGLGRRVAERRYVLEALLSQDARAVLEGLAELARPTGLEVMPSVTRAWWQERAAATSSLLLELAADAG